jgi:serpin B
VNAVYFKGDWANTFDKSSTKQEDFHLTNGSKVKVNMMKLKDKKLKCLVNPADLKATVVELPYVGKNLSMTIILPNEDTTLSMVEKDLDASKLKKILESNEKDSINVYLPKFKIEFKNEVN